MADDATLIRPMLAAAECGDPGYTDFIKRHTLELFSDDEVARMVATIKQ